MRLFFYRVFSRTGVSRTLSVITALQSNFAFCHLIMGEVVEFLL